MHHHPLKVVSPTLDTWRPNSTRIRPQPILRRPTSSIFAEQVIQIKPRPKTLRFDQHQLLQVLPQPQLPMHALLPLGALALYLDKPALLKSPPFTMVPPAPPTRPSMTHASSSHKAQLQVHAPLQIQFLHRVSRGSHNLTLGQPLLKLTMPDLLVKVLLDLNMLHSFKVKLNNLEVKLNSTFASTWAMSRTCIASPTP